MADKVAHDKPQEHAKPQAAPARKEENKDFKGIIRIVGKDLDGKLTLYAALIKVRGIGHNTARTLVKQITAKLGIPAEARVGDLSDKQLHDIEDLCRAPAVPAYMLNRQREVETGLTRTLLMNDLGFALRQDVEREKTVRTYRGWRHFIGQKVRGQHTRSTGRTGLTVGVMKKALKDAKAGAASKAQDAGAAKKDDKKK